MQAFIYAAQLTPDAEDGGFVVTFRDLPEAITQGETIAEALREARDCLEEAVANRIAMDLPIPEPSGAESGEHRVALQAQMAAKASLYIALRQEHLTKVELARRLGCDEKAVRRLLDPGHASRLSRLETALAVLGRHLVIGFEAA
jgi:antitoxin HicB